jgi:D-methionine transport system ATP-binding protein
MLPLKIAGVKKSKRKEIALEMLQVVGLADKAKAYPLQLSGGQRQRVAIARALTNNPKVLLCDEATSALDPKMTEEILNLLQEINRTRKLTVVIITHEMSVVEKICDRVAILDDGNLAEIGKVTDIFTKPTAKAAKTLVFPNGIEDMINPFDRGHGLKRLVRIAFDGTSCNEPFIASLVEETGKKVNILSANTKSVNGIGYGQMVLELPEDETDQQIVLSYFIGKGLSVVEVEEDD